ncbi:MAG: hypothetical protein M3383_03595 [Actinomycetota bacterium]|nr:hypothetical protein [Actinomycetota bacterium]
MPDRTLHTLADQLRTEDSVISPHVVDPTAPAALGELAAAGPGAAADPAAYAMVVESIREGYLLHYGEPRVVQGADPDLRLLAGDYLYALGLERLAALGDLPAVRALSDLIALGAQLADEGRGRGAPREGEALWLATAIGVATADGAFLEAARTSIRNGDLDVVLGDPGTAFELAASAGISDALVDAVHAIDFARSPST